MAEQKEKKPSLVSITAVIALFGTIALVFLLPIPIFQAVRDAEQSQLIRWLGAETDQWIMDQIFEALELMNHEVTALIADSDLGGNEKIQAWVTQRAYAAMVWMHVIMYRAGMLVMWTIFALPCIGAAMIDGHFRREVAKASFSSQSPMLHKRGVDLAKFVFVMLVIWLCIPVFVTTWAAPLAIAGFSFAWWMWVANLQKRL